VPTRREPSVSRGSLGAIEQPLHAQLPEVVPRQLQSLRDAAARLDLDVVAFSANVLRQAVDGSGASPLADVFQEIEDCARTGELRDLDRLLAELDRRAAELDAALSSGAAGA